MVRAARLPAVNEVDPGPLPMSANSLVPFIPCATPATRRARHLVGVAVALWAAVVGAGFLALWHYETTPGGSGNPPAQQGEAALPRLVLFAHPRCPCTRATLDELEQLVAHCQGRLSIHVLFFKPAGTADTWAETDLWRRAAALPGVSVSCDEDGREARRAGAFTSGHALLYDTRGRLLFSGGLTNSRGHAGDGAGRAAVLALLAGEPADRAQTPVFGCPLGDGCPTPSGANQ